MTCALLQHNIGKLCSAMAAVSFAADVGYWREVLVRATVELRIAYAGRILDRFDDAISDIYWVISTQTSRMNERLVEAADGLRLAELIDVFRRMHEDMHSELVQSRTGVEAALAPQLDSFADDVTGLAQLAERLATLRNDHDHWQQITDQLRQEAPRLSTDLDGFHTRWPRRFKSRLEPLLCRPRR